MFFDNIRLYLDDPNTGRLKIKYICRKCGKEIDEAKYFHVSCTHTGIPKYHEAEFMCTECKGEKTEA